MELDPRFSLVVDEADGQARLRFSASGALVLEEEATVLARLGLAELCDLARLGEGARASILEPRGRLVLRNGWQSWSFAGELLAGERVGPALLPKLNLFTERPGPREGRGEFLSHFLAWIRSGDERLVMVSRGLGASGGREGPPISFRIGRGARGDVAIEALGAGSRLAAGEPVAEIRVFGAEGFFAARDGLKRAFRAYGHFDRLAFLGHGGSLVPGGWESWYNHYLAIDEKIVLDDLAAIAGNGNLIDEYYIRRGKPTVFQVDDGWERAVGDWEPDPVKFPRGMAVIASGIEEKGLIPGLWFAPFVAMAGSETLRRHPEFALRGKDGRPVVAGSIAAWGGDFVALDLSRPDVGDYLEALLERAVEDWGFRYLKLDFLYAGMLEGRRAGGGAAWEHYGRMLDRITSRRRDRRGRPVAWLGCGAPLEPSFRRLPLMRVGADTRETWEHRAGRLVAYQGRPSAKANLTHTIGRSVLDGAVFVNDPDVLFCREEGMGLGEREKELVALAGFALASQIMFSDDPHAFGSAGERAFTARIVALFDRLAGGEYGAWRVGRDLYRLASRDGRVAGAINLGDRPAALPRAALGGEGARPLLARGRARGGEWILEPRSACLFGTGSAGAPAGAPAAAESPAGET